MILWNRDRTFDKKMSVKEREAIAKEIASPDTIKLARVFNTIMNVILLAIALLIFKFNLIGLALSFVVSDALLCTLNHVVFVVYPRFLTMNSSLDKSQKRLEKAKKQLESLDAEILAYQKEHCRYDHDCYWCSKTKREQCEKFSQTREVLFNFIKAEEEHVNSILKKIEEDNIKEDKRQSKDYTDKKEYFVSIGNKFEYYREKHNMVFLIPIIESIEKLENILERKPIGWTMISSTLYAYLDELQNILNKWIDLNETQKAEYQQDIIKISNALSGNIERLIERIEALDTEDIEIGISVLLKELTDESGGENNV